MATTVGRASDRAPEYGSLANPKHSHHVLQALLGIFLVMAAISMLIAIDYDNNHPLSVGRSGLKLTPKADLLRIEAKEGANWTHAPAVPPRIDRSEQARLIVNWRANEFTNTLDPVHKVRYAAWGFEGSTPGPILRARVGDLIEVHLTNDAKSTHPHNIDFHFATGPGGGASALSVSPGQTASVEVRALQPGIFMYHCATPDIPTHIANGMYGYVIVEPEGGMPEVDKEFYVVQSEFYATGRGVAALDVAKLDAEEPNYVVLNGAVGSLMGTNSPKVRVGDRVRIWYGNAGPQLISSFHVIGEIFDRVYREGDLASAPAQGVQTTLVPAGGATAVEFRIDVPGTYLLVDHAIARTLHKGLVGAIVAEGAANTQIFEPGAANPPGQPGGDAHGGGQPIGETMVTVAKGAWDPKNAAIAFSPNRVEIKVGESVMWANTDELAHTATADGKAFDSGFINPGTSFSFTFTAPGTYTYFCKPHPFMKGTVVVTK